MMMLIHDRRTETTTDTCTCGHCTVYSYSGPCSKFARPVGGINTRGSPENCETNSSSYYTKVESLAAALQLAELASWNSQTL